jgi:hypothetical protein
MWIATVASLATAYINSVTFKPELSFILRRLQTLSV